MAFILWKNLKQEQSGDYYGNRSEKEKEWKREYARESARNKQKEKYMCRFITK